MPINIYAKPQEIITTDAQITEINMINTLPIQTNSLDRNPIQRENNSSVESGNDIAKQIKNSEVSGSNSQSKISSSKNMKGSNKKANNSSWLLGSKISSTQKQTSKIDSQVKEQELNEKILSSSSNSRIPTSDNQVCDLIKNIPYCVTISSPILNSKDHHTCWLDKSNLSHDTTLSSISNQIDFYVFEPNTSTLSHFPPPSNYISNSNRKEILSNSGMLQNAEDSKHKLNTQNLKPQFVPSQSKTPSPKKINYQNISPQNMTLSQMKMKSGTILPLVNLQGFEALVQNFFKQFDRNNDGYISKKSAQLIFSYIQNPQQRKKQIEQFMNNLNKYMQKPQSKSKSKSQQKVVNITRITKYMLFEFFVQKEEIFQIRNKSSIKTTSNNPSNIINMIEEGINILFG